MEYKVIKGVKGTRKFKYYKNLKYVVNKNIDNRIEFYIADDIQKMIFKKFFKYLGILKVDDLIDMADFKEVNDEVIKEYIDTRLKDFMEKLENVVEYYSYYKQIQSQNARCRVGWFDKSEYRHLAWLQEQKEKLGKKMGV